MKHIFEWLDRYFTWDTALWMTVVMIMLFYTIMANNTVVFPIKH